MTIHWLTREEVFKAASDQRSAILCSIEHWQQIKDATPGELQIAYRQGCVNAGPNYCALCVRKDQSTDDFCILATNSVNGRLWCNGGCCREYTGAYWEYYAKLSSGGTNTIRIELLIERLRRELDAYPG